MITNRELDLIAADPADLVRRGIVTATEPAVADTDRVGDERRDGES